MPSVDRLLEGFAACVMVDDDDAAAVVEASDEAVKLTMTVCGTSVDCALYAKSLSLVGPTKPMVVKGLASRDKLTMPALSVKQVPFSARQLAPSQQGSPTQQNVPYVPSQFFMPRIRRP